VISNPSARENPEGVSGIINIVLKQKPDEGRSGGLTIGGGTTGHADVGGNLGVERGPLTVFGSYGFLRTTAPAAIRSSAKTSTSTRVPIWKRQDCARRCRWRTH